MQERGFDDRSGVVIGLALRTLATRMDQLACEGVN